MKRGPLTIIAFVLFGCLCAAPTLTAQDKPAGDARDREIRVTLRLVDFTAIDERGRHVTDLKPEEILLRVDGQPVPVSSLESYQAIPATMRDLAEGALDGDSANQQPRLIVLFFDRSYSTQGGIRRAKQAAAEFVLRHLNPQDKVMVMAYDRTVAVEPFTTDRGKTLAAIEAVSVGFEGFALEPPKHWSFSAKNKTVQEERYDAHIYVRKLNEIARFLKPFRGRKSLVLLSQGNPLLGNLALGGQSEDSSLISEFRLDETAHLFSDANTIIYSVDIAGIRTDAIERGNTLVFNESTEETLNIADPWGFEQGSQTSLFVLANETGGRIFRNSNDIAAQMDAVATALGNYYVLGFSSSDRVNGDFRAIEIATTRPGVFIRHARGFLPPRSFDQFDGLERTLHLEEVFFRDRAVAEMPAQISLQGFPRDDGSVTAGLLFDVPFSPDPAPAYEIMGYLYNAEGERLGGFFKRIEFSVREIPPSARRFKHHEMLELPAFGTVTLKAVVRDEGDGRRASQFFEINTRTADEARLLKAGTLFLIDQEPATALTAERGRVIDRAEEVSLISRRAANPLSGVRALGIDPSARSEVRREDLTEVCVLVHGMDPTDPRARFGYGFALFDQERAAHEIPILNQEIIPLPGSRAVLLSFLLDLKEMPPGISTLLFRLGDLNQGETLQRVATVNLK